MPVCAVIGAHRLRHTAATGMRAAGVPLSEIGQAPPTPPCGEYRAVARDDLAALRVVARPWPGWAMSASCAPTSRKRTAHRRVLGFKLEDRSASWLAVGVHRLPRADRGIETDPGRGRAGAGPRTAGRATVPVEATTVGGERFAATCTAWTPRRWCRPAICRPSAPPPHADGDVRHRHHRAAVGVAVQRAAAADRRDVSPLVGLMAVTGMRVGEVVGLDVDDVDLDPVTVIRETKYHKARRTTATADPVAALRRLFPTARNSAPSTERCRALLRLQPGRPHHHPPGASEFAGLVDDAAAAPSRDASPGA